MSDIHSDQPRPDFLGAIFNLCTTLSAEALDAAEKKLRANEFDVNRGEITFTELAINLASARDILKDAIEHQKLIQLPITVQKEILGNLQAISKALQGIMNNADEVINLGTAVETLNTSIWKYGLHNLSDQVLGYQAKLNQLKQQEVRIKKLIESLEEGDQVADRVKTISAQAESAVDQIAKSRLATEQDAANIAATKQQLQEEVSKASNAAAGAVQAEIQSQQNVTSIKAAWSEISPLETSIKNFFGEVDGYRRQMATSAEEVSRLLTESGAAIAKSLHENEERISTEINQTSETVRTLTSSQKADLSEAIETCRAEFTKLVSKYNENEAERIEGANEEFAAQLTGQAQEQKALFAGTETKLKELEDQLKLRSDDTIGKNYEETKKHVDELAVLKESVREQLAQATGFGQFGAFQSRQNTIAKGKFTWVQGIAVLVALVIGLTAYIAFTAGTADLHSAAFWIKLSMNVPLGFLITFCTIQYNRERRLEEEYAFKASISISLTPYRELIYTILEKDGALKDGTYTNFVIDSVRNIFSSPTEKIFESSKGIQGIPEKALKAAGEVIGTAVKAAK